MNDHGTMTITGCTISNNSRGEVREEEEVC